MNTYNFHNPEVMGQFISVDVHENNNYVMNIRAEILHIRYTTDINDELFQAFQEFALKYLENYDIDDEECEPRSTNIINLWEHRKKPRVIS